MATKVAVLEIEDQYQSLLAQDASNQDSLLSFKWLEKLILLFPMWSSKSTKNHRVKDRCVHNSINIMVSIFVALTSSAVLAYCIVKFMIPQNDIVALVDSVAYSLFTIGKLISIYYYHNNFNFPWLSSPPELHRRTSIAKFENKYPQNMTYYTKMMIILFICTMITDIASNVYGIYHFFGSWQIQLFWFTWRILYLYSMYISECVASVIFFKYAIFVNQLTFDLECVSNCEQNQISIKQIFYDYKKLYTEYKRDYCVTLRYQINITLLGIVVWLWSDSYRLLFGDVFNSPMFGWILCWIINNITTIAMILIPASILAEAFHAFRRKLWEESAVTMDEHENEIDDMNEYQNNGIQIYYVYLINFVNRFPIDAKIFHLSITRKNFIRLFITFIAAKLASYSFRYFEG